MPEQAVSRPSVVARTVADPASAKAHFVERLSVETDADDVASALAAGLRDFHVVDARSAAAYAAAHLPGAISLPYRLIDEEAVAGLPSGLLVVYCWGPGCNAATNAAARLAALGRSVKEMLGGFEYWVREGHPVEGDDAGSGRYAPDLSGLISLPGEGTCGCAAPAMHEPPHTG
jgi:rhodanese-related sulfurtransferase